MLHSRISRGLFFVSGALLAFAVPHNAQAADYVAGDFKASIDSTVSVGTIIRVADKNCTFVSRWAGTDGYTGCGFSANSDDGNRNYDKGVTSLAARITSEADLHLADYGAFVRATAYYDLYNARKSSTEFRDLSDQAVEKIGRDVRLLDAYVYRDFDLSGHKLGLRLGNQVLNWGESTFIANGINVINPIDVSAIRVPGSEVREALLPVTMASASFGLSDTLSVEGFYQLGFTATEPEASGTFFSTNDFASPGGRFVLLGFGNPIVADLLTAPGDASINRFGAVVPRSNDNKPSDYGQFGVAARIFAPALNDTEFGLYGVNYHSRLPLISARTPAVTFGLLSTRTYSNNASYFLEYPEDIQMYGGSLSTQLPYGVSLQGEYSLKKDQPLQIDDVELLQAAIAPAAVTGACVSNLTLCQGTIAAFNTNQIIARRGAIPVPGSSGQMAASVAAAQQLYANTAIRGWERFDVSQLQATATKAFPPAIGANQWVFVAEAAISHVHSMPDQNVLRLEAPGTFRGGNAALASVEGVQREGFPNATSWGYRLRARFDYLDVWNGLNLYPTIGFQHDVNGTTPSPLNTFVEARKAVNLGLSAVYLDSWTADIGYTNFFGGGNYNLLNDRDFVSLSIKYSF